MPFITNFSSGNVSFPLDIVTSATPNTETDDAYIKYTAGARTWGLSAVYVGGKNPGLTVISGIAYRIKKWTTTASSGGVNPNVANKDPGSNTSMSFTFGSTNAGAVTSGTGGPTFIGGFVSGATGPGGWTGPNADSYIELTSAATSSIDLFSSSATASMKYEFFMDLIVL